MTIWNGQSFQRIIVDWIAAPPRGLRRPMANGKHPGSRKGRDSVDLAVSKGFLRRRSSLAGDRRKLCRNFNQLSAVAESEEVPQP